MSTQGYNLRVKAFTLLETLLALALVSFVVTFAHAGLQSLQRIIDASNKERRFVHDYITFKSRCGDIFSQSGIIQQVSEYKIRAAKGVGYVELEILEESVLLRSGDQTEVFKLELRGIKIQYWNDPEMAKLRTVRSIAFTIKFQRKEYKMMFKDEFPGFQDSLQQT